MRLLLTTLTRPSILYPNLRSLLRSRGISTSTSEFCTLESLSGADGGIAVLTMNRPAAKNAISRQFLGEFRDIVSRIRFDGDVRVLVLRSLVDGVFCAGADLKERATMAPSEVSQFLYSLRQAFRELETLPQPTIASIDGAALGGGLEMALCCDLRVVGAKAKVGLPETKLAIIPGAGGTQRLSRLIGPAKAKELILTARILNAKQAADTGIANYAVDEESSFEKALSLSREILPQGPVAIRMAKLAVDRGCQLDIDSGLDVEQACYAQVIPTEDRLEGLRAFKEKRAPVYKGR
ncbi:uncharacterized protein VTP21DRAFT_2971 [Calcarisporiella thermophila]|uniref:uncharacterized protein n=1 Tax=Calcarisporiella thermophila TaxID=911321 RepID=UPI003743A7E5